MKSLRTAVIALVLLSLFGAYQGATRSMAGPRGTATSGPIFLPFVTHRTASKGAIIIDHTTTDISKIPQAYINKAKDLLRLSYGHTSHGSQIITGMGYLKLQNPLYDFNTNGQVQPRTLSLADGTPPGDLGNPDFSTWATPRTRDYLKNSGQDRNVVVWAWCGEVSYSTQDQMNTNYLTLMPGLERDYPNIQFVYMTGHLDGTGVTGNLYLRNNQIRNFVRQNDKILFDFADIESYDPDGTYYPNADDSCPWCQAYCDKHLGYCHSPYAPDCAHSHSLNCQLKGNAFWWLLARLSGWDGTTLN